MVPKTRSRGGKQSLCRNFDCLAHQMPRWTGRARWSRARRALPKGVTKYVGWVRRRKDRRSSAAVKPGRIWQGKAVSVVGEDYRALRAAVNGWGAGSFLLLYIALWAALGLDWITNPGEPEGVASWALPKYWREGESIPEEEGSMRSRRTDLKGCH